MKFIIRVLFLPFALLKRTIFCYNGQYTSIKTINMIIVQETFVAKPGMAGKLAKLMRTVMGQEGVGSRVRVMTDLTGSFNTIVMQTEFDGLLGFEQRMKDYAQNSPWREKMVGYTEMYTKGKREIFQVVE
jgi:hypothetical protein